jgi:lipid A 3-O-deacylase
MTGGILFRIWFSAALAAGLTLALPHAVRAADDDERPGTFVLQVENDLFGGGTDQYYTQGVQVTFVPKDKWEPEWFKDLMGMIPGVNLDGDSTYVVALGQQMFTPADTTRPDPDPTDRPYAGWLFGSVGAIVQRPESDLLQNVSLDIGIVGPASLGGYAQRRWHSLIGVGLPRGWGKQLHNEPGILLSYQARLRQEILSPQHFLELDVTPTAGVALGNVLTQGSVGAAVRLGQNLHLTYGPPFIRPSLPAAAIVRAKGQFGWNLFAGVEGRAVARNIFLDGNTYGDSRSVDKNNLVLDFQGGIEFTLGYARLSFTQIYRTREFEGQRVPSQFGSISLSAIF